MSFPDSHRDRTMEKCIQTFERPPTGGLRNVKKETHEVFQQALNNIN